MSEYYALALNSNGDLLSYVTSTVAGSLVVQLAVRDGVLQPGQTDLREEQIRHYAQVLSKQGVDPEIVADHVLQSLQVLYAIDINADNIVSAISRLLWDKLGDPTSGKPPAIYLEAAKDVHKALLVLFEPKFPHL